MGGKILVHTVYGEGSKFTVVLNQHIESTPIIEEKVEINFDSNDGLEVMKSLRNYINQRNN